MAVEAGMTLAGEQKRAEDWQKKYSDFDRDRVIADAAVRHGAKNIGQIRDLIDHKVVLSEQPGGVFVSVIKSGEKAVTVDEFVAALAKDPAHVNLFHAKVVITASNTSASRDQATPLQKIRRGMAKLGTGRMNTTAKAPASTPSDAPARKIARGLRGLK